MRERTQNKMKLIADEKFFCLFIYLVDVEFPKSLVPENFTEDRFDHLLIVWL